MASGTPLLTTRLPGIPADYYPFIYCIGDETEGGVYKALWLLLEKPLEELHQKGLAAKDFILTRKNPEVQGRKLYELIEKVKS